MRQKKFERIGAEGCYLLSIIQMAQRRAGKVFDVEQVYDTALGSKWIREDCYIEQPALLMHYLCGGDWSVRKEPATYRPQWDELVIQRWEKKTAMDTKAHFTLPDWDPYGDSDTRLNGELISLRIFKRIGG